LSGEQRRATASNGAETARLDAEGVVHLLFFAPLLPLLTSQGGVVPDASLCGVPGQRIERNANFL
jgi:hypothetical protein